jgi:CheY-like chemotaxis protein
MSVFIVEDDPALSRLLIALLGRLGLETEHAARGDTAIEAITEGGDRYEAILLDLMLPAANGFEILAHIAATNASLLNRVIVLTAASNAVLERIKRGPSPRRIIRKPFDLDDLKSAVLDCVNGSPKAGGQGSATEAARHDGR